MRRECARLLEIVGARCHDMSFSICSSLGTFSSSSPSRTKTRHTAPFCSRQRRTSFCDAIQRCPVGLFFFVTFCVFHRLPPFCFSRVVFASSFTLCEMIMRFIRKRRRRRKKKKTIEEDTSKDGSTARADGVYAFVLFGFLGCLGYFRVFPLVWPTIVSF